MGIHHTTYRILQKRSFYYLLDNSINISILLLLSFLSRGCVVHLNVELLKHNVLNSNVCA